MVTGGSSGVWAETNKERHDMSSAAVSAAALQPPGLGQTVAWHLLQAWGGTCCTSAPVASQRAEIELTEEIR